MPPRRSPPPAAGWPGCGRAVDDGWNVVRAVVNASWVTEARATPRGGKVVFLAPAADAGEHANAVGAALENAARTLSVEWARFGVRITAVRPREGAADDERAELVGLPGLAGGGLLHGLLVLPRRRAIIRAQLLLARHASRRSPCSSRASTTSARSPATRRRNLDFYTRVLGLRLVAKTVNQDDPSVYHLFYADEQGRPGSEMTFFEYPHAIPGRPGAGMVHRIVWRVGSPEALDFWAERLGRSRCVTRATRGDGARALRRPRGPRPRAGRQRHRRRAAGRRASRDPGRARALQGFDGVRAYARDPERQRRAARAAAGRRDDRRAHLGAARRAPRRLDRLRPRARRARPPVRRHRPPRRVGHRRRRAPALAGALRGGRPADERHHRPHYFHSIYFREPSGVLFEIADDGPGFTIDGCRVEELGTAIILPPQFEPRRERIEARLTPLPDPRAGWATSASDR